MALSSTNNASNSLSQKRMGDLSRIRLNTREDVLNVFTPNSPIMQPAKFAGRERPLQQMIDALIAAGADMVVFGERGCGKSSLANMLHDIARGEFDILDYYGLRQYLEQKGFWSWLVGPSRKKFNVIWVDAFGRTLDEVLHAVLTRRREKNFGAGLLSYLSEEADQIEVSSKIGFNKVFTSEAQLKEVHIPEKPINLKEGFEIAMQRYADTHKDELLIIIDEFETVKDRSGISQYLKSARNARFVIVGIAATTLELLGEHASIARETQAIKLEPMQNDELRLILQIGSSILASHCSFGEDALDEIIANCFGSPYWCHFLAKALVQRELESASTFESFLRPAIMRRFAKDDVASALATLPSKPECGIYEEALKQITMDDETTAKILLCIAKRPESIVSTASISKEMDSEKVSKKDVLETIDGVLRMQSSPFEERGRIRDIVSFAFRDPIFKRYILIRNAGLKRVASAHAFVFQSMSDRRDLRTEIVPHGINTWRATRHWSEMAPGDIALFWMGGESSIRGFYGWGRLTSSPQYEEREDRYRVEVRYEVKFSKPILQTTLKREMPQEAFEHLPHIVSPQGTNFLLDREQARVLFDLIQGQGEAAPTVSDLA